VLIEEENAIGREAVGRMYLVKDRAKKGAFVNTVMNRRLQ